MLLFPADFKQSPPNIPNPNMNMRKRRHGEEEIYYIPVNILFKPVILHALVEEIIFNYKLDFLKV